MKYLTWDKVSGWITVKYIEELIGPETVNTVPPATLEAFFNHGHAALTLESELDRAEDELEKIRELGIDIDAVCSKLLEDGLKSFNSAFASLMSVIENKSR